MHNQRSTLAKQLLHDAPHAETEEAVMDFFEDVGILVERGYFDEELAWEAIGYYGRMWWNACKDYIEEERRLRHGDATLFSRFQQLADRMTTLDMKERSLARPQVELSGADVQQFLEDEAGLV